MKSITRTLPQDAPLAATERIARQLVFSALDNLQYGQLTITEPDGSVREFRGTKGSGLVAEVRIHDTKFFGRVLTSGSRGVGEAYMNGQWDSADLTSLFRIALLNEQMWQSLERGWARITLPASRIYHWLNKNSRSQSRKNISAHYDLGNDFFKLFLDPTMMYSCGVFDSEADTMEQASNRKNELICQKLRLGPADHLIEIGTGWGGFALHAATHYGCRITTTTISNEQFDLANERIRAAGLQKQITVLKQDYRDLSGNYDKLVSIEMIEAVGWENYPTYFKACSNLLKDNGLMLVQAITVPDNDFEDSKRHVDFIKRYVFPGGCLPSVEAMVATASKFTNLQLIQLDDIGAHYVPTLRAWLSQFEANKGQLASLGYDQPLIRLWRFYLCYSEAAFAERSTSDVHALFAKPGHRETSLA